MRELGQAPCALTSTGFTPSTEMPRNHDERRCLADGRVRNVDALGDWRLQIDRIELGDSGMP
jgi:hypothetical protein